jgi:beta-glucanase (GH16 family)
MLRHLFVLSLVSEALGARIARRKSASSALDGNSCGAAWDALACSGQFGQEECYTCGARITWLQSQGWSWDDAVRNVAGDFYGVCGACAGGSFDLDNSGYRVVWSEDFNYTGPVDSAKWHLVHAGGGFGNRELQHYTNRAGEVNSWVSDGTLKIRARKEWYGNERFTSAKLESKASWTYGKLSIRAKIPTTAKGTWPAIWMMPKESTYGWWPNSGEIDIMEHVGYDTNKVHVTVHTGAYNHMIGTQRGGSTWTEVTQWHTYTVEWRPDVMLFALDGRVYQVFQNSHDGDTKKWPFNHDFFLIMNLAVGGDWGGSQGIDEWAFEGDGQFLEIDWVKVEQK